MKKLVSFKHFVIALAMTFAGLATFSACQDKSFDWDAAHADSAQKKFTNAFIEAFGEPAENHEWGFDLPWLKGETTTRSAIKDYSESLEQTYHVCKADNDPVMPIIMHYGQVKNITDMESIEVFEWFSTHQITWDDTTRKVGHINTHKVKDASGNIIPGETLKNNSVKGTLCDNSGKEIMKGEFSVVANGNNSGDIIKLVYYEDGGDNTRTGATKAFKRGPLSGETITTADGKSVDVGNHRNSLLDNTPDYWLDEPEIGLYINFTHAWIQNVASSDPYTHNGENSGKSINRIGTDDIPDFVLSDNSNPDPDIEYNSGGGSCQGNAMNQLRFDATNGGTFEVNDFNSGSGWGYRNQSSTYGWADQDESKKVNGDFPRYQIPQNGVLICGADFNNTSVKVDQCGGQRHDKWIIVYLKGDGYEGWYMGFDLEASDKYANSQIGANGYCNDWIIKLTAVGGPGYDPWDARIMCEDLGGEDNTVDLGGGSFMTSDIDYNDIVIDLYRPAGQNLVEVTLQAAGGTLPLILSYKMDNNTEVPLFETHELFSNSNKIYEGTHTITQDGYRIMYNTGAEEGGTSSSQKITLKFDASATALSVNSDTKTFIINEAIPTGSDASAAFKAFMDKLQIKVYRHTTVDYLSSPNNGKILTEADWQTLQNLKGSAPLMICVPRSTKWLKERQSIKLGYGGFPTWVQHPELYFWIPPGVNENFLY